MDFSKYVKQVFTEERGRPDQFLTDEDVDRLLDEADTESDVRRGVIGYPTNPLYRLIGVMLQSWMETKHCPILDLPKYDLLDEKVYVEARAAVLKSIAPLLEGIRTLYDIISEEDVKYRVREILMKLEKRGLLDLLGIRKTVGTKDKWPPPRALLERCLNSPHSEKSLLSVGARALAKHHHRDESNSWWGTSKGTEMDKNDHAFKLMTKILDNATWINVHWLPQDVYVIEARHGDGYGARWNADGSMFRGFLEPQMVDGHVMGWRH